MQNNSVFASAALSVRREQPQSPEEHAGGHCGLKDRVRETALQLSVF